MKHSGYWSYWECSHKPRDKRTRLFHPSNKPDAQKTWFFHGRLQPDYPSSHWSCSIPSLQGLLACTLISPVVQGPECFWIAVHVGGCGNKRARERAWAKGKLKGRLRKKKGNRENQNQARIILFGYYSRAGWHCWTPHSFTAWSWKDVTEQIFSILTRRLSYSTASYTQVFKIPTHNPGRKVFHKKDCIFSFSNTYILTHFPSGQSLTIEMVWARQTVLMGVRHISHLFIPCIFPNLHKTIWTSTICSLTKRAAYPKIPLVIQNST